ncbi:MAG: hypothetical protein IPO60_00420 [Flavobacteriales bacterium]|jgi:hypothetical protein|nr:hypothetical protein [Flavobacteriales bacterium]MBK6892928.1 hypothetical protein [Flavobacteriales bacterium]MBK7247439.1 hypothetical protein [Flavobacteriales bacterium]MBK9596807.1 hypothetical protein [Flavobacteriales bacterium]QQS72729.1 MAG: hypothetical protein IPP95_00385 [Flavobacteriales bacterium]
MEEQNTGRTSLERRDPELEQELLQRFLERSRPVPSRPPCSRTSTIIIRKELIPFYYAIYDHDLYRFIELQYRHGKDSPLFSIRIPDSMQPPVTSGPGDLLKK